MHSEPLDSSGEHGPLRWAAASNIGKVRQENEDAFLVEPEIGLFLVSDGMGGHRGGALAAQIVAQDLPVMIETRLHRMKGKSIRSVRSMLKKNIAEQNRQLHMEGTSDVGYKGMGTTVVLALIQDDRAYIANLGDSRAYLLRHDRLSQRSKEHSVISGLLQRGLIDPHEAENHSAQGQITHYVGMEEEAQPHVRTFALRDADRLLLCTDGLTDMVSEQGIAEILTHMPDPRIACEALIKAANTAGGLDNITTVVVDWLE